MRTVTVVLDADDTPKTIAALAALATAIPPNDPVMIRKLISPAAWFKVYAEDTNNVDATNGPARIGFDDAVDRTVATAHGTPLIPGLGSDFQPSGSAAIYNLGQTWLTGKTGDVFQVNFGTV